VGRDIRKIWTSAKILGGNADVSENKWLAKKAIRKSMKTLWMQIDGSEGAICKLLKTNATGIRVRGQCAREPAWDTPPRASCKKSLQAIEKKGEELQQERQEISRGGKLLGHGHLQLQSGKKIASDRKRAGAFLRKCLK
jgi:hypothetical protein